MDAVAAPDTHWASAALQAAAESLCRVLLRQDAEHPWGHPPVTFPEAGIAMVPGLR